MALDTDGHVFDELDGAELISSEQAIRKARAEARATLVRPARDRVASEKIGRNKRVSGRSWAAGFARAWRPGPVLDFGTRR
jgi:hypothetical protein